jgi:hypothetical protein
MRLFSAFHRQLSVVPRNILKGPQDYALVVTGALNPVKIVRII